MIDHRFIILISIIAFANKLKSIDNAEFCGIASISNEPI